MLYIVYVANGRQQKLLEHRQGQTLEVEEEKRIEKTLETEKTTKRKKREKEKFSDWECMMESQESTFFQLDQEFDKVLADMKPYVLKLPHKTDRQRCAVWIKKLCEPPSSGITGRKNRNLYTQLMLHMLKRGVLEGPFDKKPEDGPLSTLPTYMEEKVPDWVAGELAESVGSSVFRQSSLGNPAATSTWLSGESSREVRERPLTSMGVNLDKDPSLSPTRRGYLSRDDRLTRFSTTTDSDWSKPFGNSTAFTASQSLARGTTFQDDLSLARGSDREVEMRTKMIEAKYHEEKLKLQQKHDTAVQKILDRKNAEIEDVKSHYRGKAREFEDTISKLERKIQTLVKEASVVRETKDKQISELKKMIDESNDFKKNEYEKKLHDAVADFEQEKFEMQKQHTKNIQEILDDTNARLQRMEKEYSQQTNSTTSVIKELESRVHQLTSEVDVTLKQKTTLERERTELQANCDKINAELDDMKERYHHLDRQHQNTTESQEHEMRALKHKTEASLEFLKQEHSMSLTKTADTIADLEQQIEHLKKVLKDGEDHRQRQVRDLEQVQQQDKLHLENLHDKQIRSMKKELDQLEQESQKKIKRFEQILQDKEEEIMKLREQNREQALQAERGLEEFKAQVEKNQNRMFDEMKQQMEQVESDLNKSKQLRERQSKDSSHQLEEERFKHEKELAELKMAFDSEKAHILQDLQVQKEFILSEHERDLENLKESHRAEVHDLEARLSSQQRKDAKTITMVENQVRELREELVQANQLRKQQLVELGLLREEEKQKMTRDREAEIARIRAEMEQQRLELQKTHSLEMEKMLEKTNERLKGIEKEYTDRGQKSTETVAQLEAIINHLREEIKRIKGSGERKLLDVTSQNDEDRTALRKQYSANIKTIQKELDTQRQKAHSVERQLQKQEADYEEKMTRLKLNYEEKMRGLMPVEVRQELEDTIESLRSQVNSLQQRANVLQDELDIRLKNPLGPFGSRTSSPIKTSV